MCWPAMLSATIRMVATSIRSCALIGPHYIYWTDDLHSPHANRDRTIDYNYNIFTFRGLGNLGFLLVLGLGLLMLL